MIKVVMSPWLLGNRFKGVCSDIIEKWIKTKSVPLLSIYIGRVLLQSKIAMDMQEVLGLDGHMSKSPLVSTVMHENKTLAHAHM